MRVNSINTKQQFGMISPDGYLGKMKNDYIYMYEKLNKYSTPEYREHVTNMTKVLLTIDKTSPNYIVDVYTPKSEKPVIFPPCILYAYPKKKNKQAVQITLDNTNYPFLKFADLCQIAFCMKLIEAMNIK